MAKRKAITKKQGAKKKPKKAASRKAASKKAKSQGKRPKLWMPPGMAKQKAARERALAALDKSPVCDLRGVVDGSGAGGAGGQGAWTLLVTLEPWRVDNGQVQRTSLTLRKDVSQKQLDRLMDQFEPYQVVHLKARVASGEALLERLVSVNDGDADLNRAARDLQKPVTLKDPQFGKFTLDRAVNWFTARTRWEGKPVELHLSDSPEAALVTARALWKESAGWQRRIVDHAIKELLDLKNDNWLGDDEKPVTPVEFARRMKLQSVTVYADGSFEIWHHDGDLFWGHSILISGDLKKGPTQADIPG